MFDVSSSKGRVRFSIDSVAPKSKVGMSSAFMLVTSPSGDMDTIPRSIPLCLGVLDALWIGGTDETSRVCEAKDWVNSEASCDPWSSDWMFQNDFPCISWPGMTVGA